MRSQVLLDPDLADALRARGLDDADALLALGGEPARTSLVVTVDLPIAGTAGRFHLKRYLYPDWRKARHLLGRGTLAGVPPELNEFRALSHLRRLGIHAVRPVAAAARWRGARLEGHALLTEHWPQARDLAARLDDPADAIARDAALRRRVLALVAADLARMHAAGFVHRDVHARNVLVDLEPDPRVVFLDCRRGGAPRWRRGTVEDLATLLLDLEERVGPRELLRMLAVYGQGRGGARRDCEPILRARDRLERRLRRKGRPRR